MRCSPSRRVVAVVAVLRYRHQRERNAAVAVLVRTPVLHYYTLVPPSQFDAYVVTSRCLLESLSLRRLGCYVHLTEWVVAFCWMADGGWWVADGDVFVLCPTTL